MTRKSLSFFRPVGVRARQAEILFDHAIDCFGLPAFVPSIFV